MCRSRYLDGEPTWDNFISVHLFNRLIVEIIYGPRGHSPLGRDICFRMQPRCCSEILAQELYCSNAHRGTINRIDVRRLPLLWLLQWELHPLNHVIVGWLGVRYGVDYRNNLTLQRVLHMLISPSPVRRLRVEAKSLAGGWQGNMKGRGSHQAPIPPLWVPRAS